MTDPRTNGRTKSYCRDGESEPMVALSIGLLAMLAFIVAVVVLVAVL